MRCPQLSSRWLVLLLVASTLLFAVPVARGQHKFPGIESQSDPAPAQAGDSKTAPVPNPEAATSPAPSSPAPASPAPASPATAAANAAATSSPVTKEFQVSAGQPWTDTGIQVTRGEKIVVSSDGLLDAAAAKAGPDGLARGWRDLVRALPVNSAGIGALIGRIGDTDVAPPFLVGTHREIVANQSGRLFLGVNRGAQDMLTGMFKVKVQLVPVSVPAATSVAGKELAVPADTFKQVPRRISDPDGNPGDMVNFLVIGPEEKLKAAFQGAGWVAVDRTKSDAVLHALISSYGKQVYTEMPMSELYLFGRAQDFGYAHAEPVQVVASRHHLRLWKAGFTLNGQEVWVGAATHDIGFERDNRRPNAITHKIDPNVDAEREYVRQTLTEGGLIGASTYVTPDDPLKEARTATGGSFHSDGRVLVLQLQ